MQDIYCEETPQANRRDYKTKSTYNQQKTIIDYFLDNHAKLYGEENRTFFSIDNKQKIAKFVNKHRLPYQHFVAFVFRELPDTKVFANVITSENWISRYDEYVASLNLPIDANQLKSPYSLPCWGEYQTFMSCLNSFIQAGKQPLELINNFVFSERISHLTLDYIYRNLELNDSELNQHFNQIRLEKVLPYEDIDPDINLILQHYDK